MKLITRNVLDLIDFKGINELLSPNLLHKKVCNINKLYIKYNIPYKGIIFLKAILDAI